MWLTSDPAVPGFPVPVTMTSPDDPSLLWSHRFTPGTTLRGAFATSEGRYRLAAFGGACVLDVTLGPSRVADVVLTMSESGCGLALVRQGNMGDPAMWRDDPAVLITNHGVGNETPWIEPGQSLP